MDEQLDIFAALDDLKGTEIPYTGPIRKAPEGDKPVFDPALMEAALNAPTAATEGEKPVRTYGADWGTDSTSIVAIDVYPSGKAVVAEAWTIKHDDAVNTDGYDTVRNVHSKDALRQVMDAIDSNRFVCEWWPAEKNPPLPWKVWVTRHAADEPEFVMVANESDINYVQTRLTAL